MKIRPPRATISDVAHAARTGKTSVSRYLNGELHLLSAGLKARIEQAIADLSYRPSQMARGLKRGRTRLIGLIIADITNPYSVDVMSGIEAACREQGFTLLMCNTNNEVDLEQHYLQLLSSYQVEGIVVNAVGMREEVLNHLQQSLLPMVLIDRKIPDFPCDVVGLNNAEAAETATRHLVDNGYDALLFSASRWAASTRAVSACRPSASYWQSIRRLSMRIRKWRCISPPRWIRRCWPLISVTPVNVAQ